MRELAGGLRFPTSIAISSAGEVFVAESGLSFGGAAPGGRVWCLDRLGRRELVAADFAPPVNGLTWWDGALLLSEGGARRILRIGLDGSRSTVVDDLPGPGDYQVNMAVVGPDDKVYFSQGSITNAGVVGLDSLQLGWLLRIPDAHDIPGMPVQLAGVNVETEDPRSGGAVVETGAFHPFGAPSTAGQRIAAGLPCTAAIMRCNPDGSDLELVAWGVRNGFGLGFLPDGRLLAIDQGADDRGSRPLGNVPDLLYEVHPGAWCGWPDFVGGQPVTDAEFLPERGPAPTFLLANHHELPQPRPALLRFAAHSAATKFCVLGSAAPWPGQLVVALFGDEAPMTVPAGPRIGRSLARVDPRDWSQHRLVVPPLHRPIDVAWDEEAAELLVLDFGRFEMEAGRGVVAGAGSGALYRIRLEEER